MAGPTQLHPEGWERASGYSYGTAAQSGIQVHVAGQVGQDMASGAMRSTFAQQWEQALLNVKEVVRTAGGDPSNIVAMRIYVTSIQQYRSSLEEIGPSYRTVIGKHFPAMTLVEVSALGAEGALVEIEAEAIVPSHHD